MINIHFYYLIHIYFHNPVVHMYAQDVHFIYEWVINNIIINHNMKIFLRTNLKNKKNSQLFSPIIYYSRSTIMVSSLQICYNRITVIFPHNIGPQVR